MPSCNQHYVDNQGLCHVCGMPLNPDYGIAYFGQEGWDEIVLRWKRKLQPLPKDVIMSGHEEGEDDVLRTEELQNRARNQDGHRRGAGKEVPTDPDDGVERTHSEEGAPDGAPLHERRDTEWEVKIHSFGGPKVPGIRKTDWDDEGS